MLKVLLQDGNVFFSVWGVSENRATWIVDSIDKEVLEDIKKRTSSYEH